MQLLVRFSLILLIIFFFVSCNLFFSSPHGRENINDPAAQITAFTAVPSSDNSVVTMWNWREALNVSNEDIITEIKIQHSILGYPENYIFFMGETFTDKNAWQHEWKDLIPGITHYFSLFAKSTDYDNNDTWYAPLKAKVTLPGKVAGSKASLTSGWTVDNAFTIAFGINMGAVDPSNVIVLEFDIPRDMKIRSAVINPDLALGIRTNSLDSVRIYPLIQPFNEGDGGIAWPEL
ncbi:MAG: hypothetical protein KAR21_26655, partial [Spirochaetales bacterium]|nr:hypothetical protein [Spirochaetales bacterium]